MLTYRNASQLDKSGHPIGAMAAAIAGRSPSRWANYPRNVSDALGQVVGPNTLGEFLTVVAVEYDPATDRSRVGFAYSQASDFPGSPS